MRRSRRLLDAVVAAAVASTVYGASTLRSLAAPPAVEAFPVLANEYAAQVRPLLQRTCLSCHSTEKQEGELDLERFADLDTVRAGTKAWLKVAEMLDNGEMPPKDSPQPSVAERKQLRGWIDRYLRAEAYASAGDPGPVVLRRLSNAEYSYTIRDLTGVPLDPAREFPADSAAGEGFTNAGGALVMSPALLTKYFDAGKQVADHLVPLPDGFRFSSSTTRSDWTNEILARIRQLHRRHSATQGGSQVNLQGIVFDTNDGGRLPVEEYLRATIADRAALREGRKSVAEVARERRLSPKYLGILWNVLEGEKAGDTGQEAGKADNDSLLLDQFRARWAVATEEDLPSLVGEISGWQAALTRFQSVGHMKSWMVPVDPLTGRQEFRVPLSAASTHGDVTVAMVAGSAGDGHSGDIVLWQQPRLVAPGRPDLLLRDVRDFTRQMSARRKRLFSATARSLDAAAELSRDRATVDLETLATRHEVDLESLRTWFDYLGIGGSEKLQLVYLTDKLTSSANYDFVQGWGSPSTPSIVGNSSDNHVRIPGNLKPHGVCVHPSPTLAIAAGWLSPIAGTLRIEGQVTHAHPECGNGVTWSLELRRGATRQRLAAGVAHGQKAVPIGPLDAVAVEPGDLVSLLIGPRDGNHSCDLTDLELKLATSGAGARQWSLTQDVSNDMLAGNPHADRFGTQAIWHFYTEPVQGGGPGPVIPAGSLLARWQSAESLDQKRALAAEVQKLLTGRPPDDANHPDAALHRQLASLGGPLLAASWRQLAQARPAPAVRDQSSEGGSRDTDQASGLDPRLFGQQPGGATADAASVLVQAPDTIRFQLPADLAANSELVVTGLLDPKTESEGSVQLRVVVGKEEVDAEKGTRSGERLLVGTPIVVSEGSARRAGWERSFHAFRQLFPAALCYTKIVPVDEVVTLTLLHREDEPLRRLMLDQVEEQELDRLWDELHFVSHDALTQVDAFAQLMEYATQDSNPALFEPFRKPIMDRAAAFRDELVAAEPRQLDSLIALAAKAYRRPLQPRESAELRGLYQRLRDDELSHEDALRFTLARVLVAPAFLYRLEKAPEGTESKPVTDLELASRLSYFLWSSVPDQALADAATARELSNPDVLALHARRMLRDDRVRRLATEFACQWLHIYEFDALDEKSETHFPEFVSLRGDMYEESIRFFSDLFQRDASVLEIFAADHVIVNQRLAGFYGVPVQAADGEWVRVDRVREHGRGGILGFAATLAKQSGASRTSPILRGNWVSEVLLGERLPRPPKDVPRLPEDETDTEGLTVRQLVEMHTNDSRCSNCHRRIDPLGFALEGFDPIGRRREKDLANRPIDIQAALADGTRFEGLDGLRTYLLTERRDAVLRQFCKKLVGYALGRGVQLSDEPLIEEMQSRLAEHDYRFSVAVETIVRSRQFREIRGREHPE